MPVTPAPMQGGGSITFSSGFFAWVLEVQPINATRQALETTNAATTNSKTFIPERLPDYGGLRVTFQLDPDRTVPINSAPETVTYIYPLAAGAATAARISGSGFMTDYSENSPMNGIMTATATIKWAGVPTRTAAVSA